VEVALCGGVTWLAGVVGAEPNREKIAAIKPKTKVIICRLYKSARR
jgi:hypothetical protein